MSHRACLPDASPTLARASGCVHKAFPQMFLSSTSRVQTPTPQADEVSQAEMQGVTPSRGSTKKKKKKKKWWQCNESDDTLRQNTVVRLLEVQRYARGGPERWRMDEKR